MQAALQHLRQAAEELQKADRDKGGHRVQALNLTQQAITHVQAGIQYDNTHRTKGEKKYKKYPLIRVPGAPLLALFEKGPAPTADA